MKKLKKYLNRRISKIHLLLERSRASISARTFHKLRVEIKKLHALFELIGRTSKDFNAEESFLPFRRIFRQAGKIRETQIHERIFSDLPGQSMPDNYRGRLKQLQQKRRRRLALLLSELGPSALKRSYSQADRALGSVGKNRIEEYTRRKRKSIRAMAGQAAISPSSVHQLRKELKDHYYNQKSLGHNDLIFKDTDRLLEIMGRWHDYDVLFRRMRKLRGSGNVRLGESNALKNSISIISSERKLAYRRLKALLKDIS